jgi:hypothetical protein
MALEISILNTLLEEMVVELVAELTTGVADETRAGAVRGGKLQDDPRTGKINILIHPGNKEDDWVHALNTSNLRGLIAPDYELGGWFYRRRYVCELDLFFSGNRDRDYAREKAMIVLSRAEKTIREKSMPGIVDDFGEAAIMVQVYDSYLREGGGPPTYIWKGRIRYEYLTEIARP